MKDENVKPDVLADSGGNTAADSLRAAQEGLKTRKRRTKAEIAAAEIGSPVSQEVQAQLEQLYSPDNWKAIVRAPADLALTISGRKLWNLSESEVDALASSGSLVARYYLPVAPGMVALVLFGFNIAMIYGTRIMMHTAAVRKEKQDENKKSL